MQNTLTKNYTDTKTQSSFLHSDKNLFLYIEKRLNQIFIEEMNHKNSIFRKVKSSAIQKMALFYQITSLALVLSELRVKLPAGNQQLRLT